MVMYATEVYVIKVWRNFTIWLHMVQVRSWIFHHS